MRTERNRALRREIERVILEPRVMVGYDGKIWWGQVVAELKAILAKSDSKSESKSKQAAVGR